MSLFPRCYLCHRLIWPWRRMGWVVEDGREIHWHTACNR